MSESAAYIAIESVARNSYGRLIAFLAARSGDVAGAEDALGDAFVSALGRWPVDGIPQKPEAWLLHDKQWRFCAASQAGHRSLVPTQLEAAIQSIHANRAVSGGIDWQEIVLLYEGLVQIAPGIGSRVAANI
jgi:predicted RNA polymerase sigma factor